MVETSWETDSQIERVERQQQRRELVFLRRAKTETHVVHGTRRRHQTGEAPGEHFFGAQKRAWIDDLVRVGEVELRHVLGQQIVKQGRPASPVPENEQWRMRDLNLFNRLAVTTLFASPMIGIHQACQCDECGPMPIRGSDGESVLAQQPPPVTGRDSRQVVVADAPTVFEWGRMITAAVRAVFLHQALHPTAPNNNPDHQRDPGSR